jgi:2-dehydropantoate 2-reductase
MKQITSVLIAGSGAIGSMIAWQLHNASGFTVSLLAGGERLERYKTQGFLINSQPVRFPLFDVASSGNPDLVIIACKFHHLAQVLTDLENHIGADTLILSLMNGISSETIIGAKFGAERIPWAMIIGTDAGHEGNRTTFSATGTIFFGDAQNSEPLSPRVRKIADFFTRTGIAFTVPENMLNRLWFKYMLNVGLNQVTAVLRRPYRILKSATLVPEAASLLDQAMREVIAVAACEGITLTDNDIASVYRTLDTLSDEGKTSMFQDVEAGRKTEVELFSGTLIELAKKHRVPVPVNQVLFRMLRTIEQSY